MPIRLLKNFKEQQTGLIFTPFSLLLRENASVQQCPTTPITLFSEDFGEIFLMRVLLCLVGMRSLVRRQEWLGWPLNNEEGKPRWLFDVISATCSTKFRSWLIRGLARSSVAGAQTQCVLEYGIQYTRYWARRLSR